jgi:DNA-binding transcriptional ArsR family regulator
MNTVFDNLAKDIFRCWNWPQAEDTSFSTIPLPYRISRKLNVSASSIYLRRDFLYRGPVSKVVLRPSSRTLGLTRYSFDFGLKNDCEKVLRSMLPQLSFVEMIHIGTLYHTRGQETILPGERFCTIDMLEESYERCSSDLRLLEIALSGKGFDKIQFLQAGEETVVPAFEKDARDSRILRVVLYRDIKELNVSSIAEASGIPGRTVRRHLDRFVREMFFSTYPLLVATNVSNVMTYILSVSDNKKNGILMRDHLLSLQGVKEKYLLSASTPAGVSALLYADSFKELDDVVKSMDDTFPNFSVIINCETLMNEAAVGFFIRNV